MKPKPSNVLKAVLIYVGAALIFGACGKKREMNTSINPKAKAFEAEEAKTKGLIKTDGLSAANNEAYVYLVATDTPKNLSHYLLSKLSQSEIQVIEASRTKLQSAHVSNGDLGLNVSWFAQNDKKEVGLKSLPLKIVEPQTGKFKSFTGTGEAKSAVEGYSAELDCIFEDCHQAVLRLSNADKSEVKLAVVSMYKIKSELKKANLPSNEVIEISAGVKKHPVGALVEAPNQKAFVANTIDVVTGESELYVNLMATFGAVNPNLELVGPLLGGATTADKRSLTVVETRAMNVSEARLTYHDVNGRLKIVMGLKSPASDLTNALKDKDKKATIVKNEVELQLDLEPLKDTEIDTISR